jgi:hypothetical protein
MRIKASCVRCGKSIDGLHEIYCSACQHEVNQGVLGQESPTSRPRSKKWLWFLLLVVGLGFGYYKLQDQLFPSGRSMVRAKPMAPSEDRQTKPTITETLLAEKIKKEEASESGGPAPRQPGAIEPDVPEPDLAHPEEKKSETGRPSKEAGVEGAAKAAPAQPVSLAEGGAPPPTPALTESKDSGAAPAAPTTQSQEAKSESGETIWVYFAEKEGRDIALVDRLKSQGVSSSMARGRWTTKNKVNYIFFRDDNAEELEALKKKLGDLEFVTFPFEGVQTSRNLKTTFSDNPALKFLVIVQ